MNTTSLFTTYMKYLFLLLCTTAALAQRPVNAVVASEHAFAQMALDKGVNAAFLANMADSAILFRNGQPVLGRPLYENRPETPSKLIWGPAFVSVTSSGDMGISCGPWTIENEGKRVAFGSFFTVWERQQDGTYKFALDTGVSHPQPEGPIPPKSWMQVTMNAGRKKINLAQLLKLDAQFNQTIERKGRKEAYYKRVKYARFYREGVIPFSREMKPTLDSEAYHFKPLGGKVAASGTGMAFVYGTYEGANGQKGAYVRVWTQEQKEDWLIGGEVLSPTQ